MRYIYLLLSLFVLQTATAQKKQITLEDVWLNGTFRVKSVPGFNTMNDGIHYTQLGNDNGVITLDMYELVTGENVQKISITLNGKRIKPVDAIFSDDEQQILFFEDAEPIYRRSIKYRVYVYNRNSGGLSLLDTGKVLHASFSPDGSKVAFVKDNNLYYKNLKSGKIIAVTTDGIPNEIINGNCDWVYEEEFEFTKAYQWSPDSKHIAYYRFNERKVPEYTMTVYDNLYPTPYKYKYPKAGERNSIVSIRIYNIKNAETVKADVGKEKDQYIPRIKWSKDPGQLCIYRLNRLQNHLELLLADAQSGETKQIYEETSEWYVEINDNLAFLGDGQSFILNSERSGYNHLYHYNWKNEQLTDLTPGSFDVESLIGIDEAKQVVYYTAAETSPMQRQLYVVGWNGKNKKLLTADKGTHAITPCKGNKYFLDKYSTITQPPVYYLRDAEGRIVRTLEDNAALKKKMQEYNLGQIKLTTVKGANGQDLNAWMITPPGFVKTKKYPVLMYQYSGPGSQEAADRFPIRDFFWHQMLAQKGYIVVCVDGTGTGFRGAAFKNKTYLQLGKYESEDQIAAAQYLATLPYVDKKRMGIWGWSYGGFMSSTCLFKAADVFKMGIAVAPVTNWRYYDNIYTERYMRTPQENAAGYDDNSPVNMVKNLKGKFLLVHGTGDDNVHFQNSVTLVNALIAANKPYDSEYYPNRHHGISGGNTRYHLYKRMTDFILTNL